jgi:NAD(P)-dependent dehydrogenase (short-subunit alcohol dehydrogenase family)
MKLQLPSLSVNEGMARAAVAAFCAQLDPGATDIADMVAYLASEKARFITGQTMVVDGGRSLSMKGTD